MNRLTFITYTTPSTSAAATVVLFQTMSKWVDRNKLLEVDELKKKTRAILLNRATRDKEKRDKLHAEKHNIKYAQEDGDLVNSKSVSFLPPDTIAWMNRHKPLAGVSAKQSHLTPAKALHFREIFRGLDFDGSGSISLEEMEEAIQYVGKAEPDCVRHPEEINKFFRSMDVDGNGIIDLSEFLMAMSLENSDANDKMQTAFFNFAKMHRRQKVTQYLADKSIEDSKKYREFLTLFTVKESMELAPASMEEQCQIYRKQAMLDKKNLGKHIIELRKNELARANSALLHLSIENKKDEMYSIDRLLKDSNLPLDQEHSVNKKSRHLLASKLTKFKLLKGDTFTPTSSRTSTSLSMEAARMLRKMKSDVYNTSSQPKLSPISIQERITSRRADL